MMLLACEWKTPQFQYYFPYYARHMLHACDRQHHRDSMCMMSWTLDMAAMHTKPPLVIAHNHGEDDLRTSTVSTPTPS